MLRAGLVAIDADMKWAGGRYYLQHLIRCASALSRSEGLSLCSVSWGANGLNDPFADVRELLGEHVAISPPKALGARVARKIGNIWRGSKGARDLFEAAGIDVFFPIPPCERSETPYVFWLPDLQYMRRPDLMSEKLRAELEIYFFEHVRAASQIVLSSEDARLDFAKVYPEFLSRTHVVRFCSVPDAEWWRLDPLQVAASYGLPERFLIVCNQFTRHKNHLVLMEALKLLVDGKLDIHLVCTGSTFDHRQEDYVGQVRSYLSQHGLADRVHILGLIHRSAQIALLRRAVAVVQPSQFEGWSTIIEDAKTLGKPVFASDLPVHHEQLGPAQPYYLSLDAPTEWAEAIATEWGKLQPGPLAHEEAAASPRLEHAKLECGSAFARALTDAARGYR